MLHCWAGDQGAYVACLSSPVQAQECVQNLPRFVNQGSYNVERLESGTQVIIPEYSFDCYGNVTHWGAYVRNRNGIYSLDFQVWRRSGGGQGKTACYKLVGNNHFSSIRPAQRSRGQILEPIPVEQQIEVCPGDVIGFYVQNTTRANSGVQLQQQDTDDEEKDEDEGEDSSSNISFRRHVVVTAWYGSVSTSFAATGSCMLRVGRNNGYDLQSSTTAAPIITASVAVFTPSPSQISSTSTFPSSLTESTSTPLLVITQTGTSQTCTLQRTEILQTLTQFSTLSTPQPSSILSPSLLSGELGLELGVMVPTVIVVLIVVVLGVLTVVFILTMARRRMAKKQVQMVKSLDNAEYSGKEITKKFQVHRICLPLIFFFCPCRAHISLTHEFNRAGC